MSNQDLQERLIEFGVIMNELLVNVDSSNSQLKVNQLSQISNSLALNYEEALNAESHHEFIEIGMTLIKDLNESLKLLAVIRQNGTPDNQVLMKNVHAENLRLIKELNKAIQKVQHNYKTKFIH